MVTGSLPVGLYSPVITSIRAWVEVPNPPSRASQ